MKKKILLFCNGVSGSGKTYFIQNNVPDGLFYNLRSATTRPQRVGESEGKPYFFRNEEYFNTTPLATRLWVNRTIWRPGDKKWLYGVPESEIYAHLNQNLIYDVIEPKYTRQMIDWFCSHNFDTQYDFKVAYFIPPENNMDTVRGRANMPGDANVRMNNTCTPADFANVNLVPDYKLSPRRGIYDKNLIELIKKLQHSR